MIGFVVSVVVLSFLFFWSTGVALRRDANATAGAETCRERLLAVSRATGLPYDPALGSVSGRFGGSDLALACREGKLELRAGPVPSAIDLVPRDGGREEGIGDPAFDARFAADFGNLERYALLHDRARQIAIELAGEGVLRVEDGWVTLRYEPAGGDQARRVVEKAAAFASALRARGGDLHAVMENLAEDPVRDFRIGCFALLASEQAQNDVLAKARMEAGRLCKNEQRALLALFVPGEAERYVRETRPETIAKLLSSESALVRAWHIAALERTRGGETVLVAMLDAESAEETLLLAIETLGRVGTSLAVPSLYLRTHDLVLRDHAFRALREIQGRIGASPGELAIVAPEGGELSHVPAAGALSIKKG